MEFIVWAALVIVGLPTIHLVVTLGAAATFRRRPPDASDREPIRFLIIVPAHDEELLLGATLRSLRGLDYPSDAYSVAVVADNCTDATAQIAAAAGAHVLERRDETHIGKPAVLAWMAERLDAFAWADAVVVVDADCEVSPNLLAALVLRLSTGARAVQANYVVANPTSSWLTGLRSVAFTLDNYIKPLARERLGLSCGLFGTGMAFERTLVQQLPWRAFLLTEDYEYHLQLVEAGERVAFAPEAWIASSMPMSLQASHSQHARWEGGRLQLVRAYVPRMLRDGVRRRDMQRVSAALDRLVPPHTLLFPATVAIALAAYIADEGPQLTVAVAVLAGQAAFVLGGLAIARTPWRTWLALLAAPGLIAWKGLLLVEQALGHRPKKWVRSVREKV